MFLKILNYLAVIYLKIGLFMEVSKHFVCNYKKLLSAVRNPYFYCALISQFISFETNYKYSFKMQ